MRRKGSRFMPLRAGHRRSKPAMNDLRLIQPHFRETASLRSLDISAHYASVRQLRAVCFANFRNCRTTAELSPRREATISDVRIEPGGSAGGNKCTALYR